MRYPGNVVGMTTTSTDADRTDLYGAGYDAAAAAAAIFADDATMLDTLTKGGVLNVRAANDCAAEGDYYSLGASAYWAERRDRVRYEASAAGRRAYWASLRTN